MSFGWPKSDKPWDCRSLAIHPTCWISFVPGAVVRRHPKMTLGQRLATVNDRHCRKVKPKARAAFWCTASFQGSSSGRILSVLAHLQRLVSHPRQRSIRLVCVTGNMTLPCKYDSTLPGSKEESQPNKQHGSHDMIRSGIKSALHLLPS